MDKNAYTNAIPCFNHLCNLNNHYEAYNFNMLLEMLKLRINISHSKKYSKNSKILIFEIPDYAFTNVIQMTLNVINN